MVINPAGHLGTLDEVINGFDIPKVDRNFDTDVDILPSLKEGDSYS